MTIMHPVPSGEKRWHVTSESDARLPECNGSEYATAQFRDPPYLVVRAGHNISCDERLNSGISASSKEPQAPGRQCLEYSAADTIKRCYNGRTNRRFTALQPAT